MPDSRAVALSWRKSSASASGNCVEVAFSKDSIHVRDSKQAFSHTLTFSSSQWSAFLSAVRTGEFDPERLENPGTPL
jgi:Domain of unknown function (DUF397)